MGVFGYVSALVVAGTAFTPNSVPLKWAVARSHGELGSFCSRPAGHPSSDPPFFNPVESHDNRDRYTREHEICFYMIF